MLGHVGMLVPGRVVGVVGIVDLHEAHTGLAQTAGEEALAAEVVGRPAVDPVEGERLGRFAGGIEDARRHGLHPRRQFAGGDHRLDLGIAGAGCSLGGADPGEQLATGRRQGPAAWRREIADAALAGRQTGTPDGSALVDRREEGGAVVPRATVAQTRREADEAGEVGVLRPEPVVEPGSERWAHRRGGTAVEEERRWTVGNPLGVEAADDTQIVGDPRDLRKEIGDPKAALPAPRKLPQRLHDALRRALPRLGQAAEITERHLLAVVGREPRLRVETVDLAHAAGHEEENHPLGAPRKMGATRRGGCAGVQAGPGDCPEPASGAGQSRAPRPGDSRWDDGGKHGGSFSRESGNRDSKRSIGKVPPRPRVHSRRGRGSRRPRSVPRPMAGARRGAGRPCRAAHRP